MFGIGGFELFVILVFGFLIFGPDKLPDMARTIGKAIGRFRSAQEEMNEVISASDFYDPNDKEQPFKDPTIALDKMAKHQEEKRAAKAQASSGKADSAQAASGASSKDAASVQAPNGADAAPKQESFSERKARYERERAARKAAEAQAQAESEKAESGAQDANGASSSPADGDKAHAQAQAQAESASAPAEGGDE